MNIPINIGAIILITSAKVACELIEGDITVIIVENTDEKALVVPETIELTVDTITMLRKTSRTAHQ